MNAKFLNWIILISLALVWGSSFILINRGLKAFPPDQLGAYRIFIAGIFMLPFAFFHFKKEHLKHWKGFLGMGLFGNFMPAFLFAKAETGLSHALTGMLNSLTPLFTLLLGVLFFGNKTKWINVIGILIGMLGASALLYIGEKNDLSKNLDYGIYIIIATVSYGLSVNIIQKTMKNVNAVTATTYAMIFIGIPAGIYLFTTNFISKVTTHENGMSSLVYTSILGILGTAVSVIVFNELVKRTSGLYASSVTYLIPIVAIFWGITDGESILWLHFLCIGVILTGIYLVTRK